MRARRSSLRDRLRAIAHRRERRDARRAAGPAGALAAAAALRRQAGDGQPGRAAGEPRGTQRRFSDEHISSNSVDASWRETSCRGKSSVRGQRGRRAARPSALLRASPPARTVMSVFTSGGSSARSGSLRSGQDERLDAVPPRRQRLLADAADRQHEAAQRDLAGHRDVLAHRLISQRRHDRRRHRDAGRRSVFRDRAGRHVDVQVVRVEKVRRDAELLRRASGCG